MKESHEYEVYTGDYLKYGPTPHWERFVKLSVVESLEKRVKNLESSYWKTFDVSEIRQTKLLQAERRIAFLEKVLEHIAKQEHDYDCHSDPEMENPCIPCFVATVLKT